MIYFRNLVPVCNLSCEGVYFKSSRLFVIWRFEQFYDFRWSPRWIVGSHVFSTGKN